MTVSLTTRKGPSWMNKASTMLHMSVLCLDKSDTSLAPCSPSQSDGYKSVICLPGFSVPADSMWLVLLSLRLTSKFEDVCCSANKNEEKLRELITRDSAAQREEPLPHDEEEEQDLMKSQDPVVGTHSR
ncbi:hypothetical protein EYF80_025467 [Liparis tanakae]|uniref:Uncharacterized protein n=1 Tax=Liparis tanakae TaxID=230148 RepID=A0A4Z2HEP4_9TELE|nr:hypothetical protein EYF80_025467 [Liparis tanakae]